MPVNVSNQAERNLVELCRAEIEAGDIHLFGNNITPSATTVIGDFTNPATSDYAAESPGTWTAAATDGAGVAFTDGGPFEFTTVDVVPVDVYGFYVVGAAGQYLFGARFTDAPRSLGVLTPVQFSLRFTLRERV